MRSSDKDREAMKAPIEPDAEQPSHKRRSNKSKPFYIESRFRGTFVQDGFGAFDDLNRKKYSFIEYRKGKDE